MFGRTLISLQKAQIFEKRCLRMIEKSSRATTAQDTHYSFKIRTPKEFIDDTDEKHTDGMGSTGLTETPFMEQKCREHP
jgi:hypothetical protein